MYPPLEKSIQRVLIFNPQTYAVISVSMSKMKELETCLTRTYYSLSRLEYQGVQSCQFSVLPTPWALSYFILLLTPSSDIFEISKKKMIQLKIKLNNFNVNYAYFKQHFLCFSWNFWKTLWNQVRGKNRGRERNADQQ